MIKWAAHEVAAYHRAHFFAKKDMMFPCAAFAPFLAAAGLFVLTAGAVLIFLGGGSSSEKDSHAASSFVTGTQSQHQHRHGRMR